MRDAGRPMLRRRAGDASQAPAARSWASRRTLLLDARARREIIVALLLLFCYGFFRQTPAWNEYSRYDLVRALVDDGTTAIDPYEANTGDKAFHDGHVYSDKAPGTAFAGVPVYLLLSLGSGAAGAPEPDPQIAIHALAFGVSGISTVLVVLLLLRFLRPTVGERWALVISLGYGLGSIAFPFATMLFGHAASTFFLFAAFYVLGRARAARMASSLPVVAGFLAGWAVLVELTTVLGVVILLIYALVRERPAQRRLPELSRRAPVLMMVGAAIPAAMLLAYNWVSFGGPFSLGYTNLAAGGFAEGMGRGLFGVSSPSLDVVGDLLIGPRGLLRLAPWFVLAPVGLFAARSRRLRPEVAVCGAIVVAFLIFNAGYFLPFGGWTPGPRFLLPALPFAAVLVAMVPRRFRPVVGILTAVSVVLVFVATATMPNAPEAFVDPYEDLWLPRLLSGDIAETIAWTRWGFHGPQPLLLLTLPLALAALAALATVRLGVAARRLGGALTGVLVVLVVALAVPMAPVKALDLAIGRSSGGSRTSVVIVEAGATLVRRADEPVSVLWAQIENRGAPLDGTRVVFMVYRPNGDPIWSAWHDDVSWRVGERGRLTVEWTIPTVQPGDYRFDVAVVSRDASVSWSRRDGMVGVR